MLIPQVGDGPPLDWAVNSAYEGLLYFVQLMHEMLYYGSAEPSRVVSLDTYHRLTEIERTWEEIVSAELSPSSMKMMFDEIIDFASRDPVVKKDYRVQWDSVQSRLKSFADRPIEGLEAVRYFREAIRPAYLRNCRHRILEFASSLPLKNKREFRVLSENYCAFLLNAGHQPHAIFWRVEQRFFKREVKQTVERELQALFRYFPCKPRSFQVLFAMTKESVRFFEGRSEVKYLKGALPAQCRSMQPFRQDPPYHLFQLEVDAFDYVDARARGESLLTLLRAVAYTVVPAANVQWDPWVQVWDAEDSRSVKMTQGPDVLRRMRHRSAREATSVERRQRFFLDRFESEIDRNRAVNFVTTYASAFHSESPATQLLALWASLEGLLPSRNGEQSRIGSFSRDVVACQRRIYLANRFEALYHQLFTAFGGAVTEILGEIAGAANSYESKLAAAICLQENEAVLNQLGALCASNPLGRQRLVEIHEASKTCGGLYGLATTHAKKVEWQLYRIYRERNRIVHRASPSPNVGTLILSLNAYILGVVEALVAEGSLPTESLDQRFANIRIVEEARDRAVMAIRKAEMDWAKLLVIVGAM